ncbi:PREDICTED: B-cell differentiation antigen CD72 isoform X1 [Dipodomys ordii]|uniref:B-cell differentiation antigen CD72 isoform X1 n=1 Tax=Dipodomys ordii TaxID=10020 RepID=A0A1S3FZW9_DIPOR|nr:PREDICTED: B-cell differentiation antigen CD72 isoform X1 [Dipodomys ordii]
MAEAITYADLRFVKAPLKKSVSSRLEQDPEDYEDGELTYENVQVPPVPAGAPSLASSGPADTARVKAKQPAKRCMKLSASQVLPCPTSTSCLQYLLLGLLLTCLLLGVATICLGVSYLQLSQQFQQVTRILAATNSSLRQQLRERITKLGQQEENLQEYRRQLSQSQEMLQEEQRVHQVAEQQLQACQLDREQTKETLKREEEQRQALDQRLNSMQNRLKSFSTCSTLDSCCPVGWMQHQKSCFYFSHFQKTWDESQKYCTSLSSKLATFHEDTTFSMREFLSNMNIYSYWAKSKAQWISNSQHFGTHHKNPKCPKVQMWSWPRITEEKCTETLFFICERETFRSPDETDL